MFYKSCIIVPGKMVSLVSFEAIHASYFYACKTNIRLWYIQPYVRQHLVLYLTFFTYFIGNLFFDIKYYL